MSMKSDAVTKSAQKQTGPKEQKFEKYRSVEFSIDGIECPHQFRIWNSDVSSMFVLVKQNSEILGRLKVGDVMKMKYYTDDSFCPTRLVDTEISHITREDEGRFRGHYLIGLSIPDDGASWKEA